MQGFWGVCGCQWIDRSILGSVSGIHVAPSGAPALDTPLSRSCPVSLTHDVDRNCFPGRSSEVRPPTSGTRYRSLGPPPRQLSSRWKVRTPCLHGM